jgi:hypothetical protein
MSRKEQKDQGDEKPRQLKIAQGYCLGESQGSVLRLRKIVRNDVVKVSLPGFR